LALWLRGAGRLQGISDKERRTDPADHPDWLHCHPGGNRDEDLCELLVAGPPTMTSHKVPRCRSGWQLALSPPPRSRRQSEWSAASVRPSS